MIVLCPKCKTKYRVDENKMGPEGVKLRCSQCQVIFKVAKRPPAQVPPAPQPPAPAPARAAPFPSATAVRPAPVPPPTAIPAAPPIPPEAGLPAISGPMTPKTAVKAELLLADADETFLNKLGEELVEAGYLVWYARDGESAWNFIREKKPKAAIVEVMLPGLFGFEVCEKVKADPELSQAVKLVLIGSVFEKNRFRRAPTTLYGADAYVDKYHNGKAVLKKVEIVLGFALEEAPLPPAEEKPAPAPAVTVAPPAPPPRPAPPPIPKIQPPVRPMPAPVPTAPRPVPPTPPMARPPAIPKPPPAPPPAVPRPPVIAKPVAPAPPPTPTPPPVAPKAPAPPAKPVGAADWAKMVPDNPEHQKAARLARTIAADIALYNPDLVERGVREGNFFKLLAKDIEDGRKHFENKVGPEIMAVSDYYQLALEDLIAKKRKKLGLN